MEALLYSLFVANSESVTIGNLARVLDVDTREVRDAMSFACRLGFAHRVSVDAAQGVQPMIIHQTDRVWMCR